MLRLRQLALAATDLETTETQLSRYLGAGVCFRDPGVGHFGLHNGLFAVGDQFLEIVSPTQDNTTAGRYIQKRGGDTGYMVILQVDDLVSLRRRLSDNNIRTVFEAQGEGVLGLHLHPKDNGGAILSIDKTEEPSAWPWAGDQWTNSGAVNFSSISAVEIQVQDLELVSRTWAAIVDRPAIDGVISLDDADIRFTQAGARGEGISQIDLVATDRSLAGQSTELLNTNFLAV